MEFLIGAPYPLTNLSTFLATFTLSALCKLYLLYLYLKTFYCNFVLLA